VRQYHTATEAGEVFSPAEELFNRRRRTFGLFAAPLLCLAILLMPAPGLSENAHKLSAVLALMVVLWMTEAVPLA
jgi:sodium-dependent dicarboxylate transporter 2/3/5